MPIQHLFFDLDRTIWDYETNCRETLDDLHDTYLSNAIQEDKDTFAQIFKFENTLLWDAFTANKIDKEYLRQNRFLNTIKRLGLNDSELALTLEDAYIEVTPAKRRLLPGAIETLSELSKRYTLHIITNGFEDVQNFKLINCGIRDFFQEVITSDGAKARKPNPEIFEYSLLKSGAIKQNSMMFGDDPDVDIVGAQNAGWDTILVNTMNLTHNLDVKEVAALPELLDML
jgi:putative hydrolase of the HAD superfamily